MKYLSTQVQNLKAEDFYNLQGFVHINFVLKFLVLFENAL